MTEKDLINRAKVFQGNRALEGDKVKFADCCKIVLLSDIADQKIIDGPDLERILAGVRAKNYLRWWFF